MKTMNKLFAFLAIMAMAFTSPAHATYRETVFTDGTVTVAADQVTFPGGSLTDNGNGDITFSGGSGGNTLDQAYDQGSAGGGRQISASDGQVQVNVADTDDNDALWLILDEQTNAHVGLLVEHSADAADASKGIRVSMLGDGTGIGVEMAAASDEQGLIIANAGTGQGIQVQQTNTGEAIDIDHSGTAGIALSVDSSGTGNTSGAVNIGNAGNATALRVDQNGTGTSSFGAVVESDANAAAVNIAHGDGLGSDTPGNTAVTMSVNRNANMGPGHLLQLNQNEPGAGSGIELTTVTTSGIGARVTATATTNAASGGGGAALETVVGEAGARHMNLRINGSSAVQVHSGGGTPDATVFAGAGSTYHDFTNGEVWVKASGGDDNEDDWSRLVRHKQNITAVSTTTSVTDLHDVIICNNTSGGDIDIDLPAVSTADGAGGIGATYTIKKVDGTGDACIIDPNASETIDSQATVSITTQYTSLTVISDGSQWFII